MAAVTTSNCRWGRQWKTRHFESGCQALRTKSFDETCFHQHVFTPPPPLPPKATIAAGKPHRICVLRSSGGVNGHLEHRRRLRQESSEAGPKRTKTHSQQTPQQTADMISYKSQPFGLVTDRILLVGFGAAVASIFSPLLHHEFVTQALPLAPSLCRSGCLLQLKSKRCSVEEIRVQMCMHT